jgi:hypothetical protein
MIFPAKVCETLDSDQDN